MHQFGTDFQQAGSARASFVAAQSHGGCKCEEVARHPSEARHLDYDRVELGGEGCPPATSEYPAQLGPGRRRAGAFSFVWCRANVWCRENARPGQKNLVGAPRFELGTPSPPDCPDRITVLNERVVRSPAEARKSLLSALS